MKLLLAFVVAAISSNALAQTNTFQHLPVPSDFQRLQFYYASSSLMPPLGSERAVWSTGTNRAWTGDWRSSTIPKPTRSQLNAVTPQQVDLFRVAGLYTNGAWRIRNGGTLTSLVGFNPTPREHYLIRAQAERSALLQRRVSFDAFDRLQSVVAANLSIVVTNEATFKYQFPTIAAGLNELAVASVTNATPALRVQATLKSSRVLNALTYYNMTRAQE